MERVLCAYACVCVCNCVPVAISSVISTAIGSDICEVRRRFVFFRVYYIYY